VWKFKPLHSQIYFAYFAPYSYERHQDLIAKCVASHLATVEVLGSTLDGRDMELVTVGTGPLKIWLAARQHPGESMAEWLAEGFLNRILDPLDSKSVLLLQGATVYCVPSMNPDGSVRGHLRTNACGANLNREWATTRKMVEGKEVVYEAPTLERSPEVYHVLRKLDEVGCDCYVDVHGDEEIPANFFANTAGIPGWTPRLDALFLSFQKAYAHANADFQIGKGYDDDAPGDANLAICGDQVAQRFDCLAVTLEQPYKDSTFNTPMPECGWTPQRAQRLGASLVDAMLDVSPQLRA
jgi:murein tripeptide amidase MpaA